jgi:hypothetical protein
MGHSGPKEKEKEGGRRRRRDCQGAKEGEGGRKERRKEGKLLLLHAAARSISLSNQVKFLLHLRLYCSRERDS